MRRLTWRPDLVAYVGLALGCVVACGDSGGGGGSGGGPGGGGGEWDDPPAVSANVTLDRRGGVVAVTDPASPVYGASVVVPPGALAEPVRITVAAAAAAPSVDPNAAQHFGVGPIVSLQPDDVQLLTPVTVNLPVDAGVSPDEVVAARYEESGSFWREVEDSAGRRSAAGVEGPAYVSFETNHFSFYRAQYGAAAKFQVANQGPTTLDLRIVAWRPKGAVDESLAPVPVALGELRTSLSNEYNTTSFHVPPGDYLLEGQYEGEEQPRCVLETVAAEGGPYVFFDGETPVCERPQATLAASVPTVAPRGAVALTAAATASAAGGTTLDWYWTRSGGTVSGPQSGTMASGDRVTATWTAPNRSGTFVVWFTAYDGTGLFGEGAVTVEVTGPNRRPEIDTLAAAPVRIEPGADEGLRAAITVPVSGDAAAEQGVSLVTVGATDPDADLLVYAWEHALPGNFYDSETGLRLGRDEGTGAVVYEGTDTPYAETTVYYQAPPYSFVVGDTSPELGPAGLQPNFPEGFYVGIRALVSDGDLVDDEWTYVHVVPPPEAFVDDGDDGADAGGGGQPQPDTTGGGDGGDGDNGSCAFAGGGLCTNYVGSGFAQARNRQETCESTGGTWRDGPCPTAGATGACRTFIGEPHEQSTVWYLDAPTQDDIDELAASCVGMPPSAGGPGVWVSPYRP